MRYQITSRFMQQESFRLKGHTGIDFAMPNGTDLHSINEGVISRIVDYGNKNIGKGIVVKWNDGKEAIYGHLSKFNPDLHVGDKVQAGDLLGYSGNSGHVVSSGGGGYHLHFGLKSAEGEFINPSPYIDSIQNMNNPQYLAAIPKEEIVTQSYSFTDLFNSNSDIYSNLFQSLKLHMINLFSSIDYSVFIQHFQNLFQFFS